MRLIISTLKVNAIMENFREMASKKPSIKDEVELKVNTLYPKALDGFLLVLSKDGDIIYISETVAKYLGLQQIDLMGQSIYEFAHPCDHDEIEDALSPHPREMEESTHRTIFIRLKCTLTSKGRNVNLKSATYKVIKVSGTFVVDDDADVPMEIEEEDGIRHSKGLTHLIAVAEPIPHPSNIEVPLDKRTFTSRHNMNMKFTDCDDSIHHLTGYHHSELIGESLYKYHHAQDSKMIEKSYKDLFSKGQICTGQYRFLAKNGGYVWMVTQATIIYNNRTQRPQCVVCVHYVVSRVEQHGRVLSEVQQLTKETPTKATPPPAHVHKTIRPEKLFLPAIPKFSTEEIFVKKTEGMEEDYYIPPNRKRTAGSNSPIDLTHLAPQDGDVCIPLDRSSRNIQNTESFGTGLNLYDDYASLENPNDHLKHDLLLSVKEEGADLDTIREPSGYSTSSSTNPSPGPSTAPAPSPANYLKTINPDDISAMNEFFTTLSYGPREAGQEDEDIDYMQRAPFIPMGGDEDHTLLPPPTDALLNMGPDFNPGLFGCTETVFNMKDDMYHGPQQRRSKTVHEMLGGSTVKASIEQPHDTKILSMKRALDRSCLEKGPPAAKVARVQVPVVRKTATVTEKPEKPFTDKSCLMKLLTTGADPDHGYSLVTKDKNPSSNSISSHGLLRSLLTTLSQRDCEVNAPISSGRLLHGQELLNALNKAANSCA